MYPLVMSAVDVQAPFGHGQPIRRRRYGLTNSAPLGSVWCPVQRHYSTLTLTRVVVVMGPSA